MLNATRFWRVALVCLLLLVSSLSLLPLGPDTPTTGWDKTNHMLAFSALAVCGALAYPARTCVTVLALFAYGGLIEILQSFTDYRSAEWGDLLADGMGLLVGWSCWQLARKVVRR